MKHQLWLTLFAVLSLTIGSCAQKLDQKIAIQVPYLFNADSILVHIKTLSSDAFEGRRTGTSGAEKAKNYIIEKYTHLNVLPFVPDYQQPFSFTARGKTYNGVNVLGLIKGSQHPENYIVISAHYDHEGIKNNQIYNGADDNASGVAALFAVAEYFETHPPEHSVILAAFDAEELGLAGSHHFVANSIVPLQHIKLNINMDMIGRNDNNELYAVGTAFNDTLKTVISNFKNPKELTLLMGHDGKDGLQNWTMSSDHAPFHKKNIPFLYFGVEDHKDYHEPTDDFENMHPEFYIMAVNTIISIFATLDAMHF
ncbi:M28 family peptidase [Gelidibacter salicanalis]|uniref:M28 family peptidase n=1 Tax=Gelidibacter salicanalis TaxID=291193 RepID=A0A934KU42_9FLAO|nr:M28 family peptidase [Gelidibacter salicanalis]MBJ7879475.1 M28 family peptidase [Gelidibacter salicanalis]